MYAKVKAQNLLKYPYDFGDLQEENPYTNFNGVGVFQAFQGTEANLAGETLVDVVLAPMPTYDERTQRLEQAQQPVLQGGQWVLEWVVLHKSAEELSRQNEDQAKSVRAIRNQKLAETDWTQVADAPLTDEQKLQWRAYRQALRDVPLQAGFPWTVEWPAQPE